MDNEQQAQQLAAQIIDVAGIPSSIEERITKPVKELLKSNPCVDVHTHFFNK